MVIDHTREFYIEQDCNCAETLLHSIDLAYDLKLGEDAFKLVGAWGGGAGCGITCGALAGSLAALGKLCIDGQAHKTPGFKELCAAYVTEFRQEFNSIDCAELKPDEMIPGVRCIKTVDRAARLFDRFVESHGLTQNK